MERKLASVQRIVAIDSIEGADKIEVATILGWKVVIAKKDNFKVGDKVVYVEIDSILPEKPEFEFMRERKFRVKTIKLKGQISQGICFPMDILPKSRTAYNVDDDVTDVIGIKKYDPQADWEKKETERFEGIYKNRLDKFMKRYSWYRKLTFKPSRAPFPPFIKRTDENRIQLFPHYYEDWKHLRFSVTEKIDGQSATYFVMLNPKKGLFQPKWLFGVCSRNFQLLKQDNSSYWFIADKYNLKEKMIKYCERYNAERLTIQGEIIGPKIQGNKYNVSEPDFYVFNIILHKHQLPLFFDQQEQDADCRYELDLKPVPVISYSFELYPTMQEMIDYSSAPSTLCNIPREGIVVRNYENGISFKVINSEFLLKYDN
jgi:hypothetical protein